MHTLNQTKKEEQTFNNNNNNNIIIIIIIRTLYSISTFDPCNTHGFIKNKNLLNIRKNVFYFIIYKSNKIYVIYSDY